ncbi:hypothetical protein DYB25_000592 [Aphanomyces astaci]|uniref:Choloylglycine hydrolase/NAAA C-terminal domain-containing protein n=1 Tax=Aphanomyces astaci TaxID=112090 RepID=A0A397A002_APHAT|nr:hypothetical protein DYB25_000592 [Aphanomyces astaci]RHX99843.1 hypothetical protein DYB36_000421 [Aphanomyces astaci]RHY48422.1 hypothetical protein DYB38_001576 [Aphanomyces astaci]RHY56530.1 hypothetical protein DYB34_001406 [Aphanomyces astaci]RHY59952.1 hypothetical protein DYB30_000589 [Aphanomyces astaci]
MHLTPFSCLPLAAAAALCASLVHGCSDFLLNSTTHVVSARTMDFKIDLRTLVEIVPRNTLIQELIVDECTDCPDYSWRTKYGFVGLNTLGINAAADGLNEKGLAAGYLFLTGSEYPAVDVADAAIHPIISSFVTYILGNYATVDEVKAGLPNLQLRGFDGKLQALTTPGLTVFLKFPLHLPIHDASGKSIVVEFIKGKLHMYDNPAGVLTNDPPFLEQLALVAHHDSTVTGTQDLTFQGGYTPIERFQRLTFLNRHGAAAFLPNTSYSVATPDQAAVSAAVHIINTVTIPTAYLGGSGATQYTLVRDHVARVLYFRSNENQVLRSIDLTKIDFGDPTNRRALSVNFGNWHVDVTADALQSTARSADVPPRSVVQGLLHGDVSATTLEVAATAASTGSSSFWVGASVGVVGTALVAAFVLTQQRKRTEEYTPLV